MEYLTKASHPLTIPDLIDISKESNNLYNEFYFIPTNHPDLTVVGSGIKNRYKTIIPNEATRVKLTTKNNNDVLSTYINANYATGYKDEPRAYIATQGPMSNTLGDFWHMCWQENVSCIVMITKLKERNKAKCEMYLPVEDGSSVEYNNDDQDRLSVTLVKTSTQYDYEVRQLTLKCLGETRTLYHYWYTTWPDHNVPENPHSLVKLIKQVDEVQRVGRPVLVHCSAGIGRTGCFIALAIGIKQLDAENAVDVVKIVCRLRRERGGMIQTLEQYEFVYQVLAYYCLYFKSSQKSGADPTAAASAAASILTSSLSSSISETSPSTPLTATNNTRVDSNNNNKNSSNRFSFN